MSDQPLSLDTLALGYARMQRCVSARYQPDSERMRQHIRQTFCRALPPCIVTSGMVQCCQMALRGASDHHDPMYTGAIHAFAGRMLRRTTSSTPLMQRLHTAACNYLSETRETTRDDLRLVSLAAMYQPHLLPSAEAKAFVRLRLGLQDGTPLSCEEIALRLHEPLISIHEMESAVLFALNAHYAGGSHA